MRLGWPEILLILVVVMIVFGVGKLPQTMKDLGKGVREFRKAQQGDDEEEKNGAGPLVATSSAGNGTGSHAVVIESRMAASAKADQELAATKARLEAAEARLRELEKAGK